MLNRLTLARQLLVLQLGIVAVVLLTLGAVTMAQTIGQFDRQSTRRAMAVAEDVAASPLLRQSLSDDRLLDSAQGVSSRAAASAVVNEVLVLDEDHQVIAAENPSLRFRAYVYAGRLVDGRGSTMTAQLDGRSRVVAQAPVLGLDGTDLGFVVVALDRPGVAQLLTDNSAQMATVIVLGTLMSVIGSIAISRRIKRQTLGLEPTQIVALVENREALLHGIKEGVVAVDSERRVTVANDSARLMLDFPADVEGRPLHEVLADPALLNALTSVSSRADLVVQSGDRMLVVNTRTVDVRRRQIGWIATLRDRTELVRMETELSSSRRLTESLRAQSHEFSNQLQSVAGLLEMDDPDAARTFIRSISDQQRQVSDDLQSRIADPALVALVRAKLALADERGIELTVDPSSLLEPVDDEESVRLVSIVGNLVDNALDACTPGNGSVRLTLMSHAHDVSVIVRDNGPGIDAAASEAVFETGFTTKADREASTRGYGLAIVHRLCQESGGDVTFEVDDGTTFYVTLPTGRLAP